jgi:hypothetical protein
MLREGMQSLRDTWEQAQSKLRRKMRVYPNQNTTPTPAKPAVPERTSDDRGEKRRYEDARRTAVVSIYGKDITSEDAIEEARPEKTDGKARVA